MNSPRDELVSIPQHIILLNLADEYAGRALDLPPTQYREVTALAIACLLSLISKESLPANVRVLACLKLSGILFERTDNIQQAEHIVNKGIQLAIASELHDIRFRLDIMLIRIWLKLDNRTAAIRKFIQTTQDAHMVHNTYILTCLQVLKVSLQFEKNNWLECILELQRFSPSADVYNLACILEAYKFIRLGYFPQAEAAFAKVNSYLRITPVLTVMSLCGLVLSSIGLSDYVAMRKRCDELCNCMDNFPNDSKDLYFKWTEHGQFFLRMPPKDTVQMPIVCNWYTYKQIRVFVMLVSGILNLRLGDYGRAYKFLKEGSELVRKCRQFQMKSDSYYGNLIKQVDFFQDEFLSKLDGFFYHYMAILKFIQSDLSRASHYVTLEFNAVRDHYNIDDGSHSARLAKCRVNYLIAMFHQSTGVLDKAQQHYGEVMNALAPKHVDSGVEQELYVYAMLNIIVLQSRFPVLKSQCVQYLHEISPYCTERGNEALKQAYLIASLVTTNDYSLENVTEIRNYTSRLLDFLKPNSLILPGLLRIITAALCFPSLDSVEARQAIAMIGFNDSVQAKNTLWTYITSKQLYQTMNELGNRISAQQLEPIQLKAFDHVEKTINYKPPQTIQSNTSVAHQSVIMQERTQLISNEKGEVLETNNSGIGSGSTEDASQYNSDDEIQLIEVVQQSQTSARPELSQQISSLPSSSSIFPQKAAVQARYLPLLRSPANSNYNSPISSRDLRPQQPGNNGSIIQASQLHAQWSSVQPNVSTHNISSQQQFGAVGSGPYINGYGGTVQMRHSSNQPLTRVQSFHAQSQASAHSRLPFTATKPSHVNSNGANNANNDNNNNGANSFAAWPYPSPTSAVSTSNLPNVDVVQQGPKRSFTSINQLGASKRAKTNTDPVYPNRNNSRHSFPSDGR